MQILEINVSVNVNFVLLNLWTRSVSPLSYFAGICWIIEFVLYSIFFQLQVVFTDSSRQIYEFNYFLSIFEIRWGVTLLKYILWRQQNSKEINAWRIFKRELLYDLSEYYRHFFASPLTHFWPPFYSPRRHIGMNNGIKMSKKKKKIKKLTASSKTLQHVFEWRRKHFDQTPYRISIHHTLKPVLTFLISKVRSNTRA